MQKSRTRQELLDNTVRHFNSTNRSIKDGDLSVCAYRTSDGLACAIGREISDELALKFDSEILGSVCNVFDKLPLRLRNFGIFFLGDIQILHDAEDYWDKKGLNNDGREAVKEICEDYQLKNPALISNQN